ncbi:MAG TPA: PTS sugar transporter subunit IIA [Pirellulales bacterium]|nr:PTS sugar transporter subunit IIA [Pirellulales bacterium]
MELNVRDVARIMRVPERTVDRWVRQENLPAEVVGGQCRFNRAEVFEWAMSRRMDVPREIVDETAARRDEKLTLATALAAGGELRDVPGIDKEAILRAVVERLSLAAEADREILWQLLVHREGSGSTGVGGGIALPHPRYPVLLPVSAPSITLCYLCQPIEFGARDGLPVHTLFVLVSRSVRSHLTLLAQVATALNDRRFRELVVAKADFDAILADARRFHDPADQAAAANGSARNHV